MTTTSYSPRAARCSPSRPRPRPRPRPCPVSASTPVAQQPKHIARLHLPCQTASTAHYPGFPGSPAPGPRSFPFESHPRPTRTPFDLLVPIFVPSAVRVRRNASRVHSPRFRVPCSPSPLSHSPSSSPDPRMYMLRIPRTARRAPSREKERRHNDSSRAPSERGVGSSNLHHRSALPGPRQREEDQGTGPPPAPSSRRSTPARFPPPGPGLPEEPKP